MPVIKSDNKAVSLNAHGIYLHIHVQVINCCCSMRLYHEPWINVLMYHSKFNMSLVYIYIYIYIHTYKHTHKPWTNCLKLVIDTRLIFLLEACPGTSFIFDREFVLSQPCTPHWAQGIPPHNSAVSSFYSSITPPFITALYFLFRQEAVPSFFAEPLRLINAPVDTRKKLIQLQQQISQGNRDHSFIVNVPKKF